MRRIPVGVAAIAALLFVLLTPATSSAAKIPMVFTYGEHIGHLGYVTNANSALLTSAAKAQRTTAMTQVGYKYSYAGVFWISFANWSGDYCLYDGTRYVPVTREQAAILMGADSVSPPFLYRVPLGWILVGGPVLLFVAWGAVSHAREKARITRLEQDARYQQALEIVRRGMTAAIARRTEEQRDFDERSRGLRSPTHPRGAVGIWIPDPDAGIEREWLDDPRDGVATRQIKTPEDALGARGLVAGDEFRIDGVLQSSDDQIVYQLTNLKNGTFAAYGFDADWHPASTYSAV